MLIESHLSVQKTAKDTMERTEGGEMGVLTIKKNRIMNIEFNLVHNRRYLTYFEVKTRTNHKPETIC